MPEQHARRPEPLGARRAHVVLRQDLQHRRARVAAPLRHQHEGQHQHRQQQVLQPVEQAATAGAGNAAGRQPAERLGEHVDAEQAEPEGRQR